MRKQSQKVAQNVNVHVHVGDVKKKRAKAKPKPRKRMEMTVDNSVYLQAEHKPAPVPLINYGGMTRFSAPDITFASRPEVLKMQNPVQSAPSNADLPGYGVFPREEIPVSAPTFNQIRLINPSPLPLPLVKSEYSAFSIPAHARNKGDFMVPLRSMIDLTTPPPGLHELPFVDISTPTYEEFYNEAQPASSSAYRSNEPSSNRADFIPIPASSGRRPYIPRELLSPEAVSQKRQQDYEYRQRKRDEAFFKKI